MKLLSFSFLLLFFISLSTAKARHCPSSQSNLDVLNENILINFIQINEVANDNLVTINASEKIYIPNLKIDSIDEILSSTEKIEKLIGNGAKIIDTIDTNHYNIRMPLKLGPFSYHITFNAKIERTSDESLKINTTDFNQLFEEGVVYISVNTNNPNNTYLKIKGSTYMDKNIYRALDLVPFTSAEELIEKEIKVQMDQTINTFKNLQ